MILAEVAVVDAPVVTTDIEAVGCNFGAVASSEEVLKGGFFGLGFHFSDFSLVGGWLFLEAVDFVDDGLEVGLGPIVGDASGGFFCKVVAVALECVAVAGVVNDLE